MAQFVAAYGAYISLAAGAASAYVQYRQGQTQKDIGEQQVASRREDARILRENAQFEIEQQRKRVKRFKGTQR
ncbi:hypothetical protein LCGC14_3011030, partial [marine sediment metagenome]